MTDSLILKTATRLLLSLMLLFSFFILLRGHNEPGGGFIGGLIAASAFALHSIAFGPAALRQLLKFDPKSIAGAGLLCALAAGLSSAVLGDAFLKAEWLHLGTGENAFHVGSPLVFDLGVFLVVIGAVLTIVLALEEEDV
jgi:multicomponent Na+:H+ antiporter subunit B